MDHLPTPHLLVLNATTAEHHIPDDDPMQLTVEAIHIFLDSIHQQKATVIKVYDTFFVSIFILNSSIRRYMVEIRYGSVYIVHILKRNAH